MDEFAPRESYWSAQIISQLHYQAETGSIPVSGGGYGGRFSNGGFDGIWFDMSEIVRPTRDGIDGREYISTQVDLGARKKMLSFSEKGALIGDPSRMVSLPLPLIFNHLPQKLLATGAQHAILKAASYLGTIAVLPQGHLCQEFLEYAESSMLRISKPLSEIDELFISKARMAQIRHGKNVFELSESILEVNPKALVCVRLKAGKSSESDVKDLIENGISVIDLAFDYYGRGSDKRHISETLMSVNQSLKDEGIRDGASLIVTGGIACAEHMVKSILLGADAVAIDYALMAGLGCSLWADQTHPCPVEHRQVEPDIGSKRIINLSRSWRNQMIEVLGAMGMREVRRMRGELGRAIFYETEEKKFSSMFKKSKKLKYQSPRDEPVAGDCRWPHNLLQATFAMAATGAPSTDSKARRGASGGGFDRLAFSFEDGGAENHKSSSADLSISLNKSGRGPQIKLRSPVMGGGMSYGSVSANVMKARAMAAKELGSFICTGEGGYPDELLPYRDNVITQIATGLFGVSEETVQRSQIIEFKYAQGAKPGLGGHLLGGKVTCEVAKVRESVEGASLFSPFPFHSVYSVEDHKKHIDWAFEMNPNALVIVKVSTPSDIDMVACGSYYANAHIINIDGSYGGTGAAPEISKKNIAMPIEFAIPKVHDFLVEEGIRDKITILASGGIRTAYDMAKAIALGADGVVVGTADLIALGCERLGVCEKGDGCPLGLTTTDPKQAAKLDPTWGAKRIINLRRAWDHQLCYILSGLGLKSISELRGRKDLLVYMGEEDEAGM